MPLNMTTKLLLVLNQSDSNYYCSSCWKQYDPKAWQQHFGSKSDIWKQHDPERVGAPLWKQEHHFGAPFWILSIRRGHRTGSIQPQAMDGTGADLHIYDTTCHTNTHTLMHTHICAHHMHITSQCGAWDSGRLTLSDGRELCFGGESEDYYDPDFIIYNGC